MLAAAGVPTGAALELPPVHRAEQIGQLLVAPRAPGEAFRPAERRLLDDIALQAGAALHAIGLTAGLQLPTRRCSATQRRARRRSPRWRRPGQTSLMDFTLPGIGDIESVRRFRAAHPDARVLMATMLEDDPVCAALRAGARGYAVKGAAPAEAPTAARNAGPGGAAR